MPRFDLCFWLTAYKPEAAVNLSSGSINVLEELTEVRATVYLLDYQFIRKGVTQEQPDERDA